MATPAERRSRGRAALDERFADWRQLPAGGARPHGGWVRAIREALGMTAADLADRMGVGQSVLTRIERSERAGRVRLDTLQRAADALECELVYALVPRRDLEAMVADRAGILADERLRRVGHTMALEAQEIDASKMAERRALLTDHYRQTSGLWHVAPVRQGGGDDGLGRGRRARDPADRRAA